MAYSVLWTGGFDSTYRVLELSREEASVDLFYGLDKDRKSTDYELQAMNTILPALRALPETKAVFSDINIIDVHDIPADMEITDAYNKLREHVRLGSQYEWIARLAKQYPGLELGMEKHIGGFGGCGAAIDSFGAFRYDGTTGYVDRERSSRECILVLGNLRFPIMTKTELDMLQDIRCWGYEELIKNIWFCHAPIHNGPCGMCRPCQQKMEDDMQFLLPVSAQRRYRVTHGIRKVFGDRQADRFISAYRKFFIGSKEKRIG